MKLPKSLMFGVAATALFASQAVATDYSTEKQREQLLYQQQTQNQTGSATESNSADSAIGPTKPTSGPGVKGAPDTRTGPATRAPGDGSDSSAGASSGEAGSSSSSDMGSQQPPSASTKPSQDSSGVQGFPDTRTGPSTRQPSP